MKLNYLFFALVMQFVFVDFVVGMKAPDLSQAIKNGNSREVEEFLKKQEKIEDNVWTSALQLYLDEENVLKKQKRSNILKVLIQSNHCDKKMLEKKFNMTGSEKKGTLLFWVVRKQDVEIVKILLKKGATIDLSIWEEALSNYEHLDVGYKNELSSKKVLRELIENGKDVNSFLDNKLCLVFFLKRDSELFDIVLKKKLVSLGQSFIESILSDYDGETNFVAAHNFLMVYIKHYKDHSIKSNSIRENLTTILFTAIQKKDDVLIKEALALGFSIDDSVLEHAFKFYCKHYKDFGQKYGIILKLLLENLYSKNKSILNNFFEKKVVDFKPLYWVVYNQDLEMIKTMIKCGASVDEQSWDYVVLRCAAIVNIDFKKWRDILSSFLDILPDTKFLDRKVGGSASGKGHALLWMIEKHDSKMVAKILKKGFKIDEESWRRAVYWYQEVYKYVESDQLKSIKKKSKAVLEVLIDHGGVEFSKKTPDLFYWLVDEDDLQFIEKIFKKNLDIEDYIFTSIFKKYLNGETKAEKFVDYFIEKKSEDFLRVLKNVPFYISDNEKIIDAIEKKSVEKFKEVFKSSVVIKSTISQKKEDDSVLLEKKIRLSNESPLRIVIQLLEILKQKLTVLLKQLTGLS